MPVELNKQYIGDGVYVHVDPAQMLILSTDRAQGAVKHWIGLEPTVFLELLRYAHNAGWGKVIQRAAREFRD